MTDLEIKKGSTHDTACECCGGQSRSIAGFVYRRGSAAAAYLVQWTLGDVDGHGAYFDLIVGKWGGATSASDRCVVSLEFRRTDRGPGFMIVDATARPASRSDFVGKPLAREEVIGTPLAKEAYELVDAVWLQDDRIGEIVCDAV